MAKNDDWVVTVKDEMERMDSIQTVEKQHWDKRSIYKVPAFVTDLNMKAYKPQSVSFGPYHHGEHHLAPMEKHKHRALLHFLKRSNKPLESYIRSLAEVAQILKDSYESLDLAWESDTERFLRMMIVDGCFMIEVLRNFTNTSNDYADNDPIFSNHGKLLIVPYIRRDMLMLENQLPMLVLTTLLDEETKKDEEFMNELIRNFCCFTRFPLKSRMGKCLHLLDVQRKILLWEDTSETKIHEGRGDERQKDKKRQRISTARLASTSTGGDKIIRSTTEISEAGIILRKSKSQSLRDISFKGGELRLPPIVVDDTSESMFLNLIAFERLHVGVGNGVTSYIFFMDSIIHSAKDVSLLHDKGIIQNAIGNNKAVAELFNSISKNTTLDQASSLAVVLRKVHKHCKKRWNNWRLNLYLSYFAFLAKRPWWRFSVGLALFLLVLTILQTVYTMLSYYLPK